MAPARSDDASGFPDSGGPTLNERLPQSDRGNADIGMAIVRIQAADARALQAGTAIPPNLDASPNGVGYEGGGRGRNNHEFDWGAAFSDGWRARYRAGAARYVLVLAARRTLIAAQGRPAPYRLAWLQALVNLDKAVGAAWEHREPPALAASIP